MLRTRSPIDFESIITINVVFHICFDTPYFEHYIEETDWTIDELNKDYSGQATNFNNDGPYSGDNATLYTDYVSRAADSKIRFRRQQVRYAPLAAQSSSDLNVLDNNIKTASPPISPGTALNIWVVDMSAGLLGYAQFPWELGTRPTTDGVVIARGCFGRCAHYPKYNQNKTLTHEVGHWLGLYHTFQSTHAYEGGLIDYRDGTPEEEIQESIGDLVVDTPPQASPTYGNPLTESVWPESSPADVDGTHKHMWMNFMDYSDDIAMFLFTADQARKMRIMMSMYRSTLVPLLVEGAPAPTTRYSQDFDAGVSDWTLRPRFSSSNAMIVENEGVGGGSALGLRMYSYGGVTLDLTGAADPVLKINVKNSDQHTYVYIRPSGSSRWTGSTFQSPGDTYSEQTIDLPGPYGPEYRVLFRVGRDSNYTYFDNFIVAERD